MVKYKIKIKDIRDEAKGTKTYYLEKPEDLVWEEGAHTHIGLEGYDAGELPNKSLIRHMSIMTLPEEGIVGFTTRVPGSSSEFKVELLKLNIGDEVTLFKVGSRMRLRRENRPIILVSMGVGMSTLRPLILAYSKDKTDIPMLINVNVESSGEFIYQHELDQVVNGNYKNYWLSSREGFYKTLQEVSEIEQNAIYYVVGSDVFIKDMIQQLRSKNVKDSEIVLDKKEENMGLYFGA
jgi:ferredoxin--NADP+ reductase